MDGKGIVKGNRWSGKMNYLQGTFLILNHSTTTRCNIMDHNYISLMGQIILYPVWPEFRFRGHMQRDT